MPREQEDPQQLDAPELLKRYIRLSDAAIALLKLFQQHDFPDDIKEAGYELYCAVHNQPNTK